MDAIDLPRGIDESAQFLLWPMEEAVPFFLLTGVGIISEHLTACLALAWVSVRLLRRYRDSRPDGYLYHTLYWWGLTPAKGYSLRNPYQRRFLP
jgi:conjugal transfer pilus assembly protein TraL